MLQLNAKNKGFTLVELVVTMAIYSILMVIMSITLVSVSRLNKEFVVGNSYDEVIKIENFIIDNYKRHNGSLVFNDVSLIEFNGAKLVFKDHTLYYEAENKIEIAYHKDITSITRKIEDKRVVFEITYNEEVKFITLYNLGGVI